MWGGGRLIANLVNILPITVYDTYDELVFMGFISQQTMPGGAHCIYIYNYRYNIYNYIIIYIPYMGS